MRTGAVFPPTRRGAVALAACLPLLDAAALSFGRLGDAAFLQRTRRAAEDKTGDMRADADGRNAASLLASEASSAEHVPILTGCQDLCGVRDQSCTTSCQVCVEQWSCKTVLEDCDACLEHAKLSMKTAAQSDSNHIFDSGGTSMIRDGIKTALERAQVNEYHSRRELRQARERVLTAQRQAEWASQEREEDTEQLKEAKRGFENSRDDVAHWRLRSAKKLKAIRGKRRKLRQRKEDAEKDLKKAEERLKKAERRLERKEGDRADNEAKVAESRQEVKAYSKKAQDTEDDLAQQKKDAEWLDRGLKDDVDRSKRGLKAAMMNLRMANAAEIAARYSLEEAKKHYLDASGEARGSQKEVRRLQENLDNTTLHEQLLNESLGVEKESAAAEQQTEQNSDSGEEDSDDELEDAPESNKKEEETKEAEDEQDDKDPEEAAILHAEKEGEEDAEKDEKQLRKNDREEEKEEEEKEEKEDKE